MLVHIIVRSDLGFVLLLQIIDLFLTVIKTCDFIIKAVELSFRICYQGQIIVAHLILGIYLCLDHQLVKIRCCLIKPCLVILDRRLDRRKTGTVCGQKIVDCIDPRLRGCSVSQKIRARIRQLLIEPVHITFQALHLLLFLIKPSLCCIEKSLCGCEFLVVIRKGFRRLVKSLLAVGKFLSVLIDLCLRVFQLLLGIVQFGARIIYLFPCVIKAFIEFIDAVIKLVVFFFEERFKSVIYYTSQCDLILTLGTCCPILIFIGINKQARVGIKIGFCVIFGIESPRGCANVVGDIAGTFIAGASLEVHIYRRSRGPYYRVFVVLKHLFGFARSLVSYDQLCPEFELREHISIDDYLIVLLRKSSRDQGELINVLRYGYKTHCVRAEIVAEICRTVCSIRTLHNA